ncbi:MAG: hypothetical protein JNM25_17895 [Planctomycetes bacterium]|nr:hypothetical protein [Planctomycetota bacterium]
MAPSEIPPFPFEALAEAVATVAADGVLSAHNAAMRSLLAGCGGTSLATLPLDATAQQRLAAGERVPAMFGGRAFELCLHEAGGGRWLCARDVHDRERAETSELAAARVRLLGRLAGSVVHDLNNLLGSAMGLAAMLVPATKDPADRQLLEELQRGSQRSATMASALARLLKATPRQWQQVAVTDLVAEALSVCKRIATQHDVEVVPSMATDLPPIRVVAAEATQVLLQGLVAALGRAPGRLHVQAAREPIAIAGGRPRTCVRVRFAAEACRRPVADPREPAAEWQARAALVLARAGGELTVAASADAATIAYVWPAVRSG